MRPFTSTIPFADALSLALTATAPLSRTEHVVLHAADGRVVAHDVVSAMDVPPFDRAAMDGYAVRCEQVRTGADGCEQVRAGAFRCVGVVYTGEVFPHELQPGECVEIATGAPIPAGADAVVMVEDTERVDDMVVVRSAVKPRQNIGPRAADISVGSIVVSRGQVMAPSRIGALAATGHTSVEVIAKPSVAILSTGNEVVEPGLPLAPGQIYDINRFTLEAVVRRHGGLAHALPPCGDSVDELKAALDAASAHDLIVFSGGSSVGERDLVRDVIAARGEMLFHGIAVKPGKPTAFARIGASIFLGMPGNPTSCLSNAYILMVPILRKLAGLPHWEPRTVTAPLARRVVSTTDRHQFYTVRLVNGLAEPAFKGSGDITSMANADGYMEITASTEVIEAGVTVTVTLF